MKAITKKQQQIIRSWAKLRHPDTKMVSVAIDYCNTLDLKEREAMLKEFQDYVDAVRDGKIDASPVEINIPILG